MRTAPRVEERTPVMPLKMGKRQSGVRRRGLSSSIRAYTSRTQGVSWPISNSVQALAMAYREQRRRRLLSAIGLGGRADSRLTIPRIGPHAAVAFLAAIDNPSREVLEYA
jgi:hypothetical protein